MRIKIFKELEGKYTDSIILTVFSAITSKFRVFVRIILIDILLPGY